MPMRATTLVLVTVLLAILAATAVAAPGDLDLSFDVDGIQTVNWGGEGDSARTCWSSLTARSWWWAPGSPTRLTWD